MSDSSNQILHKISNVSVYSTENVPLAHCYLEWPSDYILRFPNLRPGGGYFYCKKFWGISFVKINLHSPTFEIDDIQITKLFIKGVIFFSLISMGYRRQTSVLFSWSFTNMLVLWPSMYLREIQNNSAPALLISYPEMAINSRNDTKLLNIVIRSWRM